jgi:hypothetical protein
MNAFSVRAARRQPGGRGVIPQRNGAGFARRRGRSHSRSAPTMPAVHASPAILLTLRHGPRGEWAGTEQAYVACRTTGVP